MGKLATYFSILIFIDLLFIVTGQINLDSNLSFITGALVDPSNITLTVVFTVLLGAAGLGALLQQGGVTTGVIVTATNVLAFTATSIGLTALFGDFTNIFLTLKNHNLVLATFIWVPLMIVLILTIVEWLRVKD